MNANRANINRLPLPAGEALFQMAKKFAQEAVALDGNRQYAAAVAKYTRASEVLLDLMQVNRNPKMQQLCCEKVQEYVARAKFLAHRQKLGVQG